MQDKYQKVAYIGLRNPDGTYLLNVPVYIKVTDFNKSGVTEQQEELIHKVSEALTSRYEKQLAEIMEKKKGVQNVSVQG